MDGTYQKEKCQRPIGPIKSNGEVKIMPTVGKKKFPYTKEGKMAAAKAAKKSGKKVKKKKKTSSKRGY